MSCVRGVDTHPVTCPVSLGGNCHLSFIIKKGVFQRDAATDQTVRLEVTSNWSLEDKGLGTRALPEILVSEIPNCFFEKET